jgi:hypothetical protein
MHNKKIKNSSTHATNQLPLTKGDFLSDLFKQRRIIFLEPFVLLSLRSSEYICRVAIHQSKLTGPRASDFTLCFFVGPKPCGICKETHSMSVKPISSQPHKPFLTDVAIAHSCDHMLSSSVLLLQKCSCQFATLQHRSNRAYNIGIDDFIGNI